MLLKFRIDKLMIQQAEGPTEEREREREGGGERVCVCVSERECVSKRDCLCVSAECVCVSKRDSGFVVGKDPLSYAYKMILGRMGQ